MEDKPICIREVNENIRRVEIGQPLTRSLRILNQFCDFRSKYEDMYGFCGDGWKRDWVRKGNVDQTEEITCKNCFKKFKPKFCIQLFCSTKCYKKNCTIRRREWNRVKHNIPKSRWRIK